MAVIAGAVSLAVAEVAYSADFAGMALPAVAGVVSPADLAGMAFPSVAGVTSLTDLAGMAIPAVAGPASWPLLRWRPNPIRWMGCALLVGAAHGILMVVWCQMIV